ncbi:MAG: hypothetical protein MUE93_02705 [Ignavibacteriaceae bacterium]|nr:hypothetical protein [Ignavibacteriaceae bacterium]MCU0406443.1 hypothetical protein [Ignavibacteriaceae bacterium]MCU0413627.1 hypothetical protein [Ignavibacteriaceae bacterium]
MNTNVQSVILNLMFFINQVQFWKKFTVLPAIQRIIKNYFHPSVPKPAMKSTIQTASVKMEVVDYHTMAAHLVCVA